MDIGNNVLMPFNCLINTDFGIIKVLKEKYNNPEFMESFLVENDDNFYRLSTVINDNENIVNYYLKSNHLDKADQIRKLLLEKEYENILEHSEKTGIFTLTKEYKIAGEGAIHPIVLCKNELEQQYIKRLDNTMPTTIDDLYKIDLSVYDSIFLRDIVSAIGLKLTAKNIFVLNYRFNFEDEYKTLLKSVTSLVSDVNIFYNVDVYADTVLEQPAG